jgi:hypothetical protein
MKKTKLWVGVAAAAFALLCYAVLHEVRLLESVPATVPAAEAGDAPAPAATPERAPDPTPAAESQNG